LTNQSPITALRSALTGDPKPLPGSPFPKIAGVGAVPAGGGDTAPATVTAGVQSRGGALSPGSQDSRNPTNLVSIGQGGHKLQAPAAASLARVEKRIGRKVLVTDSFRTQAQQADCHARKPDLCAPAGNSAHEMGLAIDVDGDPNDPALVAALTAEGWHRNGRKIKVGNTMVPEPWHWSYGISK